MPEKKYNLQKNKIVNHLIEKFTAFYEKIRIKNIEQYQKKEAEFLPAALEIIETPPGYASRLVLWTFVILAVSGILWITFGRIDEVAVASGKIIPIGYVQTLQAEDKGIIKNIYISDGQKVKKGDILLEMDSTMTAADLVKVKKEYAYSTLEFERLMAEKQNLPFLPQKVAGADQKDIETQQSLYNSRMLEYKTKLDYVIEAVNQYSASLNGALSAKNKLERLYAIAKDKEARIQQLSNENAIAQFTLLDHQAKRIELEEQIAEQNHEIRQQQALLAQSRQNMALIKAERNTDIDTKLAEARQKLAQYGEELKKVDEKNRLSQIIAPVDGYVSNLSVHTIGGIVTAAQVLLEIVPEETQLEVEAWVANKDIGFVHEGQQAELKVETFNFQKFGTIPAVVTQVNPNTVEDQEKGRVYRVVLSMKQGVVQVNGREVPLTSGMTVNAEIKTRQKRIYEFFLEPFKQYKSEALRER